MAQASVQLIVDAAKAVNPLRKVQRESEKLNAEFKKSQKGVRDIEAALLKLQRKGSRALRDLQGRTQKLSKSMGGLRANLAKVAIGFAAFKAVQTGIARIESERRIKLLARSYGEVAELQQTAAASADKFKLSQTEANQALANAYARLRPLGVSLQDISSTFNGFRTAAVLGGATAQEASNAFTQLSQALGAGALRGDEFRSVAEQAPLVLQAISDETGIATSNLKDYAKEGLLTSDVVIKALKRIETEGADKLTEALDGPAAKIKEFQNATEDVQVALSESVIPALTDSFSELAAVIRSLEPAIKGVGEILALTLKDIREIVEFATTGGAVKRAQTQAEHAAFQATKEKFGLKAFGTRGERGEEVEAFFQGRLQTELARRVGIAKGIVPGQLPPSAANLPQASLPKGTTTIDPPTKSTSKSAADTYADRVKAGAAILLQQERTLELMRQDTDLQRQLLQIQYDKQDAAAKIRETTAARQQEELLANNSLIASNKENAAIMDYVFEQTANAVKKTTDLVKARQRAQADFKQFFKNEMEKEGEAVKQLFKSIGDAISTSVVDALTGAIQGTQKLADIAINLLSTIGRMLVQFGLNSALGSIPFLKPLFGRANGGPVQGGRPYIVGERGPELFMPSQSGQVSSNEEVRRLMGRSPASAATQMNFTFETTNIGGTEYVSREQLELAMATTRRQAANDGAQRGMSMTLDRMQNSPRTRSRLGIA